MSKLADYAEAVHAAGSIDRPDANSWVWKEVLGEGFSFSFLHSQKMVDKTVAQKMDGSFSSWQKEMDVFPLG